MNDPAFNLAQCAIRPDWYDHLPQVEAAMAECARVERLRYAAGWTADEGGWYSPEGLHEFDWENEGWPWFSVLHHAQSYWNYRHLPNLLFVHYGDLKADPEGEIRRIAGFLGIEHTDEAFRGITEAVRLQNVQKNSERIVGDMDMFFEGGAKTFLFKGTNGRWKDVLSEAELVQYRAAMEKSLAPECARWMEQGGIVR